MLEKHLIATTDPVANPENTVTCGDVRVTVLRDRLFRIEQSDCGFTDQATQSVWFRAFGAVNFKSEKDGAILKITTDSATLFVNLTAVEKSSVLIGGKEVPLRNKGIMAGTARTLDMNRRGEVYVSDASGKTKEIPFTDKSILCGGVTSREGVAYFDDGESLILQSDGMVGKRNREKDIYVFAYGHDYYGAVSALYALTGKTPMLPRYVFGNWWSRYHDYTESEYLELLDKFEERKVPLSVATVDIDWHYVDIEREFALTEKGYTDPKFGSHSGWTGYSWNKKLFPDYRRFLRELHRRGHRVTLNLHPSEGVRWFEDCYERVAARMGKDPESKEAVPFDFTDTEFINAYFTEIHRPYEADGVDFWWIDWQQGIKSGIEGYDPLWGLNHFHYLDSARNKDSRPLILSRYAGIGAHRYPLGFSGDTVMTWELLDFMPYFTATASNIGYTLWSHDIGAHYGGIKDNELYLRWLEFGTFSPVMRLHSCNSPIASKEPWSFDGATESVACEVLRRRDGLVPYVYSLAADNHYCDRPIIVPLYYKYPECAEAYEYPNEYFFGDLLVAPITRHSDSSRLASVEVWLPKGEWYDIYNHRVYRGGKKITVARDSSAIPVFMRAGDFLVTCDCGTKPSAPQKLNVLTSPGVGRFSLYEDDGITRECENGRFARTNFRSQFSGESMKIAVDCAGDCSVLPDLREYEFTVMSVKAAQVRCDGKKLKTRVRDGNLIFRTGKIASASEHCIELTHIVRQSRDEYVRHNLVSILSAYNGNDNFVTEEIYNKLCSADDFDAVLAEYALPANLVCAVSEVLKK